MNGHPRARMDTILRQREDPINIYNSKGFPASIYRLKWSFIVGQGSKMIFYKKNDFLIFFWNFIAIQGVQGATPEGPEPFPELKNIKYIDFSKFWKNR